MKKKINERRKVIIDFSDDTEAEDFKVEMKKRFHYPKVTSKSQVVCGKGKRSKSVFVEEKEYISDPLEEISKLY